MVAIEHTTELPGLGTQVKQNRGGGMHVVLDVNNRVIRPLEEPEIEQIAEKAASLWPKALIDFLNHDLGT